LLWNAIESALRNRLVSAGIDVGHTYKWEQAAKMGILDMQVVQDITELRMIRNKQVHSTSDELDRERISFGVSLAEQILERLKG
jgi:hypothetical protein